MAEEGANVEGNRGEEGRREDRGENNANGERNGNVDGVVELTQKLEAERAELASMKRKMAQAEELNKNLLNDRAKITRREEELENQNKKKEIGEEAKRTETG
eukprot:TRINITY_DN4318_c0_g1_i3.p1 TRINITY_DN4318_c0_g1~~TRINITY_DN4318_c0_g1_i3.p1  ORF type:complete len:102 (-),score=54.81 TRINITY_DN4318_c0_g1_i3:541-846(-)